MKHARNHPSVGDLHMFGTIEAELKIAEWDCINTHHNYPKLSQKDLTGQEKTALLAASQAVVHVGNVGGTRSIAKGPTNSDMFNESCCCFINLYGCESSLEST